MNFLIFGTVWFWLFLTVIIGSIIWFVESALDGFSTTVTLNIFGNPLIQIGDIVNLSYNLNGMDDQKHVVTAVSHAFSNGLITTLSLSRIKQ